MHSNALLFYRLSLLKEPFYLIIDIDIYEYDTYAHSDGHHDDGSDGC